MIRVEGDRQSWGNLEARNEKDSNHDNIICISITL